jgi:hypothetical protein
MTVPIYHMAQGYPQASGPRDEADVPRWHPRYWRRFPLRAGLYLLGALAAAFASLIVLRLADGQQTDEARWRTASPSVYLSILAVVARSLVQAAFQTASDSFWWDQLLSPRGTRLGDLHHTWQFGREAVSLFHWHKPWNLVRSAGLSMLVLAAVGPLLQQSVSTELVTTTSQHSVILPVRIEPMWNLTVVDTNAGNGFSWSTPMYQPEFASIALDHTLRRPPVLAGSGFCNGNCTANITVAGFTRNCTERMASPNGLPYLMSARPLLVVDRQFLKFQYHTIDCETLAPSNSSAAASNSTLSYCSLLQTYYQLAVDVPTQDPEHPAGQSTLLYTSYVRPNPANYSLLVQECTFSTAFLNMTIDIANDSSVVLSSQYGQPQDRLIEPIGSPTISADQGILGGFLQAMRDAYEGYVLWDTNEGSNVVSGSGPRLYGDTTNVTQTSINVVINGTNTTALAVPFRSPLVDFTNTLNELALRYALADVPDADAVRVKNNEAFISQSRDSRNTSLPAKTRLSKTQTVVLDEARVVSVFRVNYRYALGASCVVLLASIATAPLLSGWRHAGRQFTVSPLEVAKAFDAPLLAAVPSGALVGTVIRDMGDVQVRYGEVPARDDLQMHPETEVGKSVGMFVGQSAEGEGERRRLVIGRAHEVVPAEAGVQYMS